MGRDGFFLYLFTFISRGKVLENPPQPTTPITGNMMKQNEFLIIGRISCPCSECNTVREEVESRMDLRVLAEVREAENTDRQRLKLDLTLGGRA